MKKYSIENVFTPQSFPHYTYIDRKISNNETYESELRRTLLIDEQIILIVGSYKSGKTTLYRNVIPASQLVSISGKLILNEEEFWQQIAQSIAITSILAHENVAIDKATYIEKKASKISEYLLEEHKILVIDDFQCINKKLQAYIINVLKRETTRGLKSIIVSVSHEIDYICKNPALSTTAICVLPWKSKALEEIAYRGFSLLNIHVTEYAMTMLTKESMACPQLMQENCYKLAMFCKEQDMTEVTDEAARRIIPYMKDIMFL